MISFTQDMMKKKKKKQQKEMNERTELNKRNIPFVDENAIDEITFDIVRDCHFQI